MNSICSFNFLCWAIKEFYNIKYISKSFQGTQMLLAFYIESKFHIIISTYLSYRSMDSKETP